MQSTNKTIPLLTIGNTIMDLEFKVSDDVLDSLSIDKGSMTLIDQQKKDAVLQSLNATPHLCCGGSVANSLYIANTLGCKGHHIGVVGHDDIGQQTIADYNKNGIGHSFNDCQLDGDSGCCIVLITPDGERTMLTYLGVSSDYGSFEFMKPLIAQSNQLFIEGYLVANEACYTMILEQLIPFAKESQTKLILTLSDAGLVSFFKSQFQSILATGFDLIFCNRSEAQALSDASTI